MSDRLLMILFFYLLFSCNSKPKMQTISGFKFYVTRSSDKAMIHVVDCGDSDYVKYGALSELILDSVQGNQDMIFYFTTRNKKTDSLKYYANEITLLRKQYKEHPCVLNVCKHIVGQISNEKIEFYDSILYNIMLYDAKLNGIDTAYYAKRDISIVSILYNRCLYNIESPPKEYEIQAKYFQVLPIWCENKKKFPLFDEKDFMVK